MLYMYSVCHAFASVHCRLVVTCWERAGLLALVCDVYLYFVTFPCGILCHVWYLIVSIPDLCRPSFFTKTTILILYQLKGKNVRFFFYFINYATVFTIK